MSTLPRELAPWASVLQLFPPESVRDLAPLVRRLASAVGPLRAHDARGAGEPDGFDGLARRGSYERLLATEWLLADEAPDEFTRRAAAGEHAFLRVARREPHRARECLVLFDAGPSQLGAPRLAHLAALVVLARRAEAAGASFRWGIVQTPDGPVFEGVTEANVRALLEARTPVEPESDDFDWRVRYRQFGDALPDDLWLVGGERLARVTSPRTTSRLAVRDPLEPGVRALHLTVRDAARPARELVLPLPDDRACTRLLRDPFAAAAAQPFRSSAGIALGAGLLFSPDGTKLFARAAAGGVLAIPVPNSPREPAGRPRHYTLEGLQPPGISAIVAVGWSRRAPVFVTATERQIAIASVSPDPPKNLSRVYEIDEATGSFAVPPANRPLLPCYVRRYGPRTLGIPLVLDEAGTLFECAHFFEPEVQLRCPFVAAIAPTRDGVVYVGWEHEPEPGRPQWQLVTFGAEAEPRVRDLPGSGRFRSFFGYDDPRFGNDSRLLAYEQEDRCWRIRSGAADEGLFSAPPDAMVVGVASRVGAARTPGLVALEADRRTLTFRSAAKVTELPVASADIVHVVVSHAAPNVAYLTGTGELVVYSLAHEAVVLRAPSEPLA